MNNNAYIKLTIAAVLILGISIFVTTYGSEDTDTKTPNTPTQTIVTQTVTDTPDAMEPTQGSEDVMAKSAGSFEDYSEEKISRAADGTVVLFFHAAWCPTCKALEDDINKNEIPDGLNILKVNYDSESALRKKYEVTYQHTLVQVDAEGNQVKKWSGGNTLDSIISRL